MESKVLQALFLQERCNGGVGNALGHSRDRIKRVVADMIQSGLDFRPVFGIADAVKELVPCVGYVDYIKNRAKSLVNNL